MPKGKLPQRIKVNAGGAPMKGRREPWSATWPLTHQDRGPGHIDSPDCKPVGGPQVEGDGS